MNNHHAVCSCGKVHTSSVKAIDIRRGACATVAGHVRKLGGTKAFLLADSNTYPLAGDRILSLLKEEGIAVTAYVFPKGDIEPDERSVGRAVMHFDPTCDIVITLGSGVLNDIGKILSHTANLPYIIVATAPSMDGYASKTSSVAMDGLKVSLPSKCPEVIIGDIDILETAPVDMLKAGLGDMLAKYVSICEWRLSHLITGEYYCETVAGYVKEALAKCVRYAEGLLDKDEDCICAVFEGLVACGSAMEFAGLSRPASGIEHYFSHIWDMRGLEFGTKTASHGLQCAVGTLYALKAYEQLRAMTPNPEKAIHYAEAFDFKRYKSELTAFLGKSADAMIALEEKEQKYDLNRHKNRLMHILESWDEILQILDEELPSVQEFEALLDLIKVPKTAGEIGIDEAILPMTFRTSKDIRDKYVLSRLAWDLGVLEEITL